MLCARTPALEALAVELSEVADGRRELGGAYAAAAAALSADETGTSRSACGPEAGIPAVRNNVPP